MPLNTKSVSHLLMHFSSCTPLTLCGTLQTTLLFSQTHSSYPLPATFSPPSHSTFIYRELRILPLSTSLFLTLPTTPRLPFPYQCTSKRPYTLLLSTLLFLHYSPFLLCLTLPRPSDQDPDHPLSSLPFPTYTSKQPFLILLSLFRHSPSLSI